MKTRFIVAALLFSASLAFAGFIDGNELKKLSDASERTTQRRTTNDGDYQDSAQYHGYIVGVFDAQNRSFRCIPNEFKVRQLAGIVTKYLNDHPEQWDMPGSSLVTMALLEAFPCKK